MNDLQMLDAVATEHGRLLAFRACEESDDFEPVFLRVGRAGVGQAEESAMLSITDANGMSLGSYVISRRRLDAALAEASDHPAADCSAADRLV